VLRGCGVEVRLVVARPVDPGDLASIPGTYNTDVLVGLSLREGSCGKTVDFETWPPYRRKKVILRLNLKELANFGKTGGFWASFPGTGTSKSYFLRLREITVRLFVVRRVDFGDLVSIPGTVSHIEAEIGKLYLG
jgi:hypothetical protein